MIDNMIFNQNDAVRYVGSKLNKIRNKVGIVCARVDRSSRAVVCEFGNDSYVVDFANLVKHKFSQGEEESLKKRFSKYDDILDKDKDSTKSKKEDE